MKVIKYRYFDLYLDGNKKVVKIIVNDNALIAPAIRDAVNLLKLRKEEREIAVIVRNKQLIVNPTDNFDDVYDRFFSATTIQDV